MRLSEIEKCLDQLDSSHVVLNVYKNGYFKLILNTNIDQNIGFDLDFDQINKRFELVKFKKDPYKRVSIIYLPNMTTKQINFIKKYLIINYFKNMDYLL